MYSILVVAIVALGVSVVTVFVMLIALSKMRGEIRRSEDSLDRVHNEWELFSSRNDQESRRLFLQFEQLEAETRAQADKLDHAVSDLDQRLSLFHDDAVDTRECLDRVNDLVGQTQQQLESFEQYTKDFLQHEMTQAFDKFDLTVSSVLGEMKQELLRGVERIDEIQAVVESKGEAQQKVFGSGAGGRLLGEAADRSQPPSPSEAPAFEEAEGEQGGDEPAEPEVWESEKAGFGGEEPVEGQAEEADGEARPFEVAPVEAAAAVRPASGSRARRGGLARVRLPGPLGKPRSPRARARPPGLGKWLNR